MTQPGEDLHELEVPLTDTATRSAEAPAEDVFEQAPPAQPVPLPFDANEADVYEQSQVVELDDEY